MASNSFGTHFRFTTWGESHGPAVGVVVDGCPAGLALTPAHLEADLARRAPGRSPYTSPRKEPDAPEILSGLFEGRTLGTPISILVRNRDVDSSPYKRGVHRPGHAEATYEAKYGHYDYRGGGRASARETVGRVIAGAIAKQLLARHQIEVSAHLPEEIWDEIAAARDVGDSIGGIVEMRATGVPAGLGDPIYQKLEAELASAMLSINACKGFEIGSGFELAKMRGSEATDPSHAGGVVGGISNGLPIDARAIFKPTSTISQKGGRHDPCVAVRAVPVVEAMLAIVLADRLLASVVQKTASSVL